VARRALVRGIEVGTTPRLFLCRFALEPGSDLHSSLLALTGARRGSRLTMAIHTATVRMIGDGRVTIPSEIREVEGIKEGDYIKITVEKIKDPGRRT